MADPSQIPGRQPTTPAPTTVAPTVAMLKPDHPAMVWPSSW
jgi:hypothetical protein